jgi:hypothetical protein
MSTSTFYRSRLRLRAALGALVLGLPGAALADATSAETGACLEDASTVRACSTKELSNVVVQCGDESGSFFLKYDELDQGAFEGLTSPFEGSFACPEGEVIAVFIKSGRNKYDGPALDGLPSGSGASWSPSACGAEEAGCPSDGDEGGGDEGGGDEGGGDEGDVISE